MFVCPVCAYPRLPYPPLDFLICPSCGTEFGYHDSAKTYPELRASWIAHGMRWHSRAVPQPRNWNPVEYLISEGYVDVFGKSSSGLSEHHDRIGPADVTLEYSWAAGAGA
jgi:hypothetical protein